MKKSEVNELHNVLSQLKYPASLAVKMVRNIITAEPVKDELTKAQKTAQEKFYTDEMKELAPKSEKDQPTQEYNRLFAEYRKNMGEALMPSFDAISLIKFEKLTEEEFKEVVKGNDNLVGADLVFIYKHLVSNGNDNISEQPA